MNGAEKPLLLLAGKPLIAHVIARIAPQVDALVLNANGEPAGFEAFGYAVIPDREAGHPGPIAGVLAGFEWMKQNISDPEWLVSAPCDCPFLPRDLVQRLIGAATGRGVPVAIASSGTRHHPVVAVWNAHLRLSAEDVLHRRGLRKMDDLVESFANTRVEFAANPNDPFFNINTPADLAHAEALMTEPASA